MRILVLCTGNSCRSQMAEGFIRHFSHGAVDVFSAGLEPKRVNPYAVKVMQETGVDISRHTSKHLDKFSGQDFSYVITVCDNAAQNCPTFPTESIRLHWPFDDPAIATGTNEEIITEFRRIRDQIEAQVKKWLAELGISD